jgi:hypothetical protein
LGLFPEFRRLELENMHRRTLLASTAALGFTALGVPTPAHAAAIDVLQAVKALRIPTGPYAGGYEIAPNGKLNWYFAALGLLPLVQWMSPAELETHIRAYLDLYLRKLTPSMTIDDVDFPKGRADFNTFTLVPSDSDDSYAATFLSLAARYLRASGNKTWWSLNKRRLKDVAYRNIAVMVKPNGLTSVFQPPRSATNSIGYLMDNCEVYRGLRDFAEALRATGDTADANYYDAFAAVIAQGIAKLFNSTRGAFRPGDAYTSVQASFYPGTTCQVFPQAFGVQELAGNFTPAWNYLNTQTPNWQDGRYDPFPWAVLGFVAALRKERVIASTQMTMIEQRFAKQRAMVTINELGFYQRMVNVLAGGVDV